MRYMLYATLFSFALVGSVSADEKNHKDRDHHNKKEHEHHKKKHDDDDKEHHHKKKHHHDKDRHESSNTNEETDLHAEADGEESVEQVL